MHPLSQKGTIAQLVEQRTENPCVPGSIPGGTTKKNANKLIIKLLALFVFALAQHSFYYLNQVEFHSYPIIVR